MATLLKRKQVNLSMEQKLSALKRLDRGESVYKIASDLGVGRSTIDGWKKKRADIEGWCLKRYCTESLKERKNMKESEFREVSEALYEWFQKEKNKGLPITGPMLQKKALKIYKESKKEEDAIFVASVGWLDRWKKRYGIRQLSVGPCDEELSGDQESVFKLEENYQGYVKGERYNDEDESRLNVCLPPEKSRYSNETLAPEVVIKEENPIEEEEGDEGEPEDKSRSNIKYGKIMSHSEGLRAIEDVLRYFEQQGDSPSDLLFLRHLRDKTARRTRIQCKN